MNKKYGETPQQKVERALNQPEQNIDIFGMSKCQSISVVLARLTQEFEKGQGPDSLYDAWKNDIANSFCSAVDDYCTEKKLPNTSHDKEIVLHIANTAAKTFLDNLCKQTRSH